MFNSENKFLSCVMSFYFPSLFHHVIFLLSLLPLRKNSKLLTSRFQIFSFCLYFPLKIICHRSFTTCRDPTFSSSRGGDERLSVRERDREITCTVLVNIVVFMFACFPLLAVGGWMMFLYFTRQVRRPVT